MPYSNRSVYHLPRFILWPNGARLAGSMYRNRLGMWGRRFHWYHFRSRWSTLIPQTGFELGGGIIWQWNYGQASTDRAKLCIERYWEVVGCLSANSIPRDAHSSYKCIQIVGFGLYLTAGKKDFVQRIGGHRSTICVFFPCFFAETSNALTSRFHFSLWSKIRDSFCHIQLSWSVIELQGDLLSWRQSLIVIVWRPLEHISAHGSKTVGERDKCFLRNMSGYAQLRIVGIATVQWLMTRLEKAWVCMFPADKLTNPLVLWTRLTLKWFDRFLSFKRCPKSLEKN